MRANIEAHLRAVGAGSAAESVDVEAEARRAGALALSQLDVLQSHRKGTRP
jgi:hypothetical protein